MKNIITLLVSSLLLLCSCSGGDCASVIPADAKLVAEIDLTSISTKAALGGEDVTAQLTTFIDDVRGGSVGKRLSALADNPLVLTLVLQDRMYAFTTADYFGFVAKVTKEELVEGLFKVLQKKGVCSELTEKKGYKWAVYKQQWIVAFDDNRMFVMGPVGPSLHQPLRNEMLRLLSQSSDESFAANPNFDRLSAQNGDIAIFSSVSALPEMVGDVVSVGVPEGVTLDKVQSLISLDFDKGEAVLRGLIYSDDDAVQAKLDAQSESMHRIAANHAKMAPADFVAWGTMAMDGDDLLASLKKNSTTSALIAGLNAGIDADQIVRTVNGDASFCIPSLRADGTPEFLFYADVKDKSAFADIDYWKKSVAQLGGGASLRDAGQDEYVLTMDEFKGHFGVRGTTFYAASGGASQSLFKNEGSKALSPYMESMKESCTFFVCNVDALRQSSTVKDAMTAAEAISPALVNLVKATNAVTVRAVDACNVEMKLISKDRKDNFIKQLMK